MKKQLIIVLAGLAAVMGSIIGIRGLQIFKMATQKKPSFTETVTTVVAKTQNWESLLTSTGSLTAVQGVMVSAEVAGKVSGIEFEPGTMVKVGDLLVQQDIDAETAQLRSAEASVALAKVSLDRARTLLAKNTVPQSDFDNAEAQHKQAVAQADNVRALIAKKTIRAPFDGILGIRMVNLGQIMSAGDPIVSLQSLDPIFVDFSLPQRQIEKITPGLAVRIETDALPGRVVQGTITAINPQVEAATRNVMVQATVANPEHLLHPGMFVNVTVVLPATDKVLVIPVTAVLNAPYSDSVFIVEDASGDGASGKVVRQQFVRTGERRGDFAIVTAGLKEGETIVSTGAFKLRNGQPVVIDNTLAPEFKLEPSPNDT